MQKTISKGFIFLLLLILPLNSCSKPTVKFINSPLSIDYQIPTQFPKEYYQLVSLELIQVHSDNIPILMYHSIDSPKYWIDRQTFRNHLKLLFDAGFSTMKLEDYLQDDFSHIPEGRKPVILTFDDQWGSQFYYDDVEGKQVSNQSAVGILEEFAKLHPDFGKNAVFYLFFHRLPFQSYPDRKIWKTKITYLLNNGFEIGCHTLDHSVMTNMKPSQVKSNLSSFYKKLEPLVGDQLQHTMTLAYPGGYPPRDKNSIQTFSYKGFQLICGLKASGGFAKVPASKNFEPFNLPRIEGSTKNIQNLIQQTTFTIKREKVSIPKIFATSSDFISDRLKHRQNKNTIIFKELNP